MRISISVIHHGQEQSGSGKLRAHLARQSGLLCFEALIRSCFPLCVTVFPCQSFDEFPEIVIPAMDQFLKGNWPANAEKVTSLLAALRRGERPKPGSMTGRQTSAPEGGPTTLTSLHFAPEG